MGGLTGRERSGARRAVPGLVEAELVLDLEEHFVGDGEEGGVDGFLLGWERWMDEKMEKTEAVR